MRRGFVVGPGDRQLDTERASLMRRLAASALLVTIVWVLEAVGAGQWVLQDLALVAG
jgi:hypothetical protein